MEKYKAAKSSSRQTAELTFLPYPTIPLTRMLPRFTTRTGRQRGGDAHPYKRGRSNA